MGIKIMSTMQNKNSLRCSNIENSYQTLYALNVMMKVIATNWGNVISS